MTGKLAVRVVGFKPVRSNTLYGFVDVALPDLHLVIKEATVHESKEGKRWVGLPARPQLNKDGCIICDDRGKKLYIPTIQFDDRATYHAFSARVLDALAVAFPHAFSEPETATP
jgi:hypothetical protein